MTTAGAAGSATTTAGAAGSVLAGAGGEGEQGRCTLVIGPAATGEWFTGGFESLVDDDEWEVIYPGYIENWAISSDPVYDALPQSACTANANNPDRIVYQLYTKPEDSSWWVAIEDVMLPIDDALTHLKAKYPGLLEVDLLPPLIAQDNKACDPQNPSGSTVGESVDYLKNNIMGPVRIVVLPKFYAPNCGAFMGGGPELTAVGSMEVAALYAQYFAMQP